MNTFYKYINNTRRTKENIHPLLDVRGNKVMKDEEKADILSAFLPQSLFVRPIVLTVPSPLTGRWWQGVR